MIQILRFEVAVSKSLATEERMLCPNPSNFHEPRVPQNLGFFMFKASAAAQASYSSRCRQRSRRPRCYVHVHASAATLAAGSSGAGLHGVAVLKREPRRGSDWRIWEAAASGNSWGRAWGWDAARGSHEDRPTSRSLGEGGSATATSGQEIFVAWLLIWKERD